MNLQTVILAGGLGTRLRPLTMSTPKPMVHVKGRPFLEHLLRYGASQGVEEFVLCTGYLGDRIEEYFGDGSRLGLTIIYSREKGPLGTAGALRNALPLLRKDFLLLNGDTWLPLVYEKLISKLRESAPKKQAIMTVVRSNGVAPNVRTEGENVVVYDKLGKTENLNGVDAGIVALRRTAIEESANDTSLELQTYPRLIRRDELLAFHIESFFADIGSPNNMKRAEEMLGPC